MTPIPTETLSGEQFDKVNEFKKRYSEEGGLYAEFKDEDTLRKIVNRLFEEIAESHGGPPGSHHAPQTEEVPSEKTITQSGSDDAGGIATVSKFDDIGLFEVSEKLTQVAADQARFFGQLTKNNEEATGRLQNANSEMQTLVSLGQASAGSLRGPIDSITAAMDESSAFLEDNLPAFRQKNDELVELTDAGFDIATDFAGHAAGGDQFRVAVEQIVYSLGAQRSAIEETIQTIKGLPRMTTAFNRAKRRQIENQSDLLEELNRLSSRLTETLDKYPIEVVA